MTTVASLRQEARQLGLRGYSRLRKAQVAQLIDGYRMLERESPLLAACMLSKRAKLPARPAKFRDPDQIDMEDWLADSRWVFQI